MIVVADTHSDNKVMSFCRIVAVCLNLVLSIMLYQVNNSI